MFPLKFSILILLIGVHSLTPIECKVQTRRPTTTRTRTTTEDTLNGSPGVEGTPSPVKPLFNLTTSQSTFQSLSSQELLKTNGSQPTFFFTNVGPNSFEYRGMFSPGQAPPADFHKNFAEFFDNFPDFPANFPKSFAKKTQSNNGITKPQTTTNNFPNNFQQNGFFPELPAIFPQTPANFPQVPVNYPQVPITNFPQVPITNFPQVPITNFHQGPQVNFPKVPANVPRVPANLSPPPRSSYPSKAPGRSPQEVRYNSGSNFPQKPATRYFYNNNRDKRPFQDPQRIPRPQPPPPPPPVSLPSPPTPQRPLIAPGLLLHQQPPPPDFDFYRLHHLNGIQNPATIPHLTPNILEALPRIDQQPPGHNNQLGGQGEDESPFRFPFIIPEYHVVRGQDRAESYPKIFRFEDGRTDIVAFEQNKKQFRKRKGRPISSREDDLLSPDRVPREKFMILHGGFFRPHNGVVSRQQHSYEESYSSVYYDRNELNKRK